uniref:Uncharacterized protein n=1 Tax=Anguilla anguilla TaxID=7936 RepID=A0A0E9PGP8_ANGAN
MSYYLWNSNQGLTRSFKKIHFPFTSHLGRFRPRASGCSQIPCIEQSTELPP